MNRLFQSLTWGQFCGALIAALVLYYLYIALRWYRDDILKLFRRGTAPGDGDQRRLSIAVFRDEEQGRDTASNDTPEAAGSGAPLQDFQVVTAALRAEIAECAELPYDPAVAAQRLKALLQRYPQIRNSPERKEINHLIATECGRNGIALLTEEVVDQWW